MYFLEQLQTASKLIMVTSCPYISFSNPFITFHLLHHTRPKSTYGKAYICCDVLPNVWHESILYSILCVCVSATQMLDKSSWQDNEARRVFGLHRVNMVIWVLKLLLLPIDGCWYLVSEPMYLCRCHLLHFLLISPWTWNRLEQKGQLHVYSVSTATCSLPT